MFTYEVDTKEESFEVTSDVSLVVGDIITRYSQKTYILERFEIEKRRIELEPIGKSSYKACSVIFLTARKF